MEKLLKILTGTVFLVGVFIFFPSAVKASSPYDQTIYSSSAGLEYSADAISKTASVNTASTTIYSVTMRGYMSFPIGSDCDSVNWQIILYPTSNDFTYNLNHVSIQYLGSELLSSKDLFFDFQQFGTPFNLKNSVFVFHFLPLASCSGYPTLYLSGTSGNSSYFNTLNEYYYGNPDYGLTPYMIFNSTEDGDKDYSRNFVEFAEPPYTNGLITTDFRNWQVCYNLVTGTSGIGMGTTYGYYIAVSYGTSTPYGTTDIFGNGNFFIAVNSLPEYSCVSVAKNNSSFAGDYVAQAGFYYKSLGGTDSFIASSTVFSYTIASGTPVNYPLQDEPPNVACNFNVSNTGSSVVDDTVNGITNGGCKLLAYLFVPDKSVFSKFGNIWASVQRKPPLGYFTISTDALTEFSTSTPPTASITPVSLGVISNFVVPVDVMLATLVTMSFLFFLFHRFRKFNL